MAILEDQQLVNPAWRPHLLAATAYYLPPRTAPDSPLVQRARTAIRELR